MPSKRLHTPLKTWGTNDSIADALFLDSDEDKPIIQYQATITSPEDEKIVRSNDGTIDIHVVTEPEKENNQKLQLSKP